MSESVQWATVLVQGQRLRLEYTWVHEQAAAHAPVMVFLHEGLGSVALWKDYPAQLCQALGFRGLVYSRPGYGRSSPRPAQLALQPDFMHHQALEVLPAMLRAVGLVDEGGHAVQPLWLLGHSDGGSIALIHASVHSSQLAGLIVMAPHIMVEDLSVASIAQARDAYLQGELRQRLSRYHDDPDSAFWGWNDVWLSPAFRPWSIEQEITSIGCPVLAVQGLDDEYGTLEQIRGIERQVSHTQLLELPQCGHSPHRDQPQALTRAITSFVEAVSRRTRPVSYTAASAS